MKIGIIGAGMVGRAIGKLAVALGHSVMLSNSRGPQTLFSLSRSMGCQVGTVEEAAALANSSSSPFHSQPIGLSQLSHLRANW